MERLNNTHIEGIQNEYRRINAKWLQMHYRLLLWLALFTAFMEIVMFFVLGRINAITASNTVYLVKYLLIPSACNLAICAAAVLFMRSPWPDTRKMYAISMLTVTMAFLVCFFHAVFKPLFLVFTIPALLAAATDQAMPFRFGGDEFCVLFRGCQREEVLTACRAIQEQFLQAEIHRLCRPVSVSIGVAEHLAEERPSRLLERADAALYQAKQEKGSIWMEA